MSLLLDALKKAAEDKLKKEQSNTPSDHEDNSHNDDEGLTKSVELESQRDASGSPSTSTECDNEPIQADELEGSLTEYDQRIDEQDEEVPSSLPIDPIEQSDPNVTQGDFTLVSDDDEVGGDPVERTSETNISLRDASEFNLDITNIGSQTEFQMDRPPLSKTDLNRFLEGGDTTTGFYGRSKDNPQEGDDAAKPGDKAYESLTQNMYVQSSGPYVSSPQHAAQIFRGKGPNKKNVRLYVLIGLGIFLAFALIGMTAYEFMAELNEPSGIVTISPRETNEPKEANNVTPEKETVDSSLLAEQEDYNEMLQQALSEHDKKVGQDEPKSTADSEADYYRPQSVDSADNVTVTKQTTEPTTVAAQAGEYRIQRQQKTQHDTLQAVLMRGYRAYNSGDLETAEVAYRQALRRSPRNRDALLGMAAIRVVQSNTEDARRYYQQLLQLNPKDDLALAGLAGLRQLSNNVNQSTTEMSQIKSMLEEKPHSAPLHFALGNLLAAQSRWPEAQQAYFEAYRLTADNPDYAYNLAVSLEHLGKSKMAIQFYQQALQLAEQSPAHFSKASIRARIQKLSDLKS